MMKLITVAMFLALTTLTSLARASNGGERGGIGNPADVNCVKLGGSLRETQNSDGVADFCVIEEWTLFRAMHTRGSAHSNAYGVANPASVNCIANGGALEFQSDANGSGGFCVIDAWKLYQLVQAK